MFIILLLLFGPALSTAVKGLSNNGEFVSNSEAFLKSLVPGFLDTETSNREIRLSDLIDKNDENYQLFMNYMEQGYTLKHLTFNIYDDTFRNATIALFRIFQRIRKTDFAAVQEWAEKNINSDMYDYALQLVILYNNKFYDGLALPRFLAKPNYYINSETIMKAFKINFNPKQFNKEESMESQIFKHLNVISINTNYSDWNSGKKIGEDRLDYFREDLLLNNYYYGLHLLHPFWMPNDELDQMNPRHAEHYYFSHRQLMARYLLETWHMFDDPEYTLDKNLNNNFYTPSLVYDNGMAFPIRSSIMDSTNEASRRLKEIDIAIQECITRGIMVMDNGTVIKITEDNYIDLLAKLIRANFDGITTAKLLRSIYGYGGTGHEIDQYNPAPSLLHHPETTLRDQMYWLLLQSMLRYFTNYEKRLDPYDLSLHETSDIIIQGLVSSPIVTYFSPFQIRINAALGESDNVYNKHSYTITSRQLRLNHDKINFEFEVKSEDEVKAIVRLFLGPECNIDNCWLIYDKFFQLDTFQVRLTEGSNSIFWSPAKSNSFSFDYFYNLEFNSSETHGYNSVRNKFSYYKFPVNLLIPRGLEKGLNYTLFVMITPDHIVRLDRAHEHNLYKHISHEWDSKPLGFPFHRRAKSINRSACNYQFYNITVYHKDYVPNVYDYFQSHLYSD